MKIPKHLYKYFGKAFDLAGNAAKHMKNPFAMKNLKHFKPKNLSAAAKQLLKRRGDFFSRQMARKALRKSTGKNILTAWSDPKYRKLIGKQTRKYMNEYLHDIKHPLSTIRRQAQQVVKGYDPAAKQLYKRTRLGQVGLGATLFGIPAINVATELASDDPDASATEKVIRAASIGVPDILSPKAIPSMIAWQIPDLIYGKRNLDKAPTTPKTISKRQAQKFLSEYGGYYGSRYNKKDV